MPLRIAARKVPDATFLPVDFEAYNEASEQVMETLRGLGVVEVLGWDEAFVGSDAGVPEDAAHRIQRAVLDATRLHCSVGIGDNKIRAKIATGFGKPAGVFRLTAANWFEVMGSRPAIDLWGVGSRVSKRLAALGIDTVAQLAAADTELLVAEFGPRMGTWYGDLGHGRGSAVVDDTPWVARGHSRETTYQQNLTTPEQVEAALRELVAQVHADTEAEGRPAFRVGLKVRYAPFFTQNWSKKLPAPTHSLDEVTSAVFALAARMEPGREVRLLGVRAEMVMPDEGDARERTPVRGLI
jgi:DNA polymerase-4